MSNIDKKALRLTAEKAKDNFMPNLMVPTREVLALLDELEAKDKAWSAQDNHINQQADRIESLEKKNGDLGRALGAAEKRTAELLARDITIKQHAQALFEAIANPSDHYVPAYARCLREALNGTSTGKGE